MWLKKVLVHSTIFLFSLILSFIIMYNLVDDILLPIFYGNTILYIIGRLFLSVFIYCLICIIIIGIKNKKSSS